MKRKIMLLVILSFALVALLIGTDPTRVPSFILFLPFLLIFSLLFMIIVFLLEKKGFSSKKRIQIASLGVGAPIFLLVLQSIGQLTPKDVLVLSVLFVISYFYIARSKTSP